MKRRSIKFAIVKEMQIKKLHSCITILVRAVIIKKTTRAREDMEEKKFSHILMGI